MIRVLLVFVVAAVVAGVAVWIADRPGLFYVEWQNREIQGSVGGALLILLIFVLFCMLATYLYFVAQRMPAIVRQRAREQKHNRGLQSLTKGLIAISTGDRGEALRYAKQAKSLLPDQPLTHVLLAEAAQANDDGAAAEEHYKHMLQSPTTELLGLQGLIQSAINKGDQHKAIEYAEKAYRLKPKSSWAYKALVQYQSHSGNWDAALETVERGSTAGVVDLDSAKRKKGIFLTAKAYRAFENGDYEEAEALAVRAQRLFPGFTPAAIMAANALAKKGNQWTASGTLEEAWREEPHPAIIESYVALKQDESARARNARLAGLAEMRPDHLESKLLSARLAINGRNWTKARDALSDLLETPVNPRVAALMAEISQGDGNDEGATREWLARAVTAEPESDWLHTDFRYSDADWASLADSVDGADTTWPPMTIGGRKALEAAPLSPFAQELRSGEIPEAAKAPEAEEKEIAVSKESESLKSKAAAGPLVSSPAGDDTTEVAKKQQIIVPPARPKPQQAKKKKLKLAPVIAADGKRNGESGARPDNHGAVKTPSGASPGLASEEDVSLPRQPDDPGPVS